MQYTACLVPVLWSRHLVVGSSSQITWKFGKFSFFARKIPSKGHIDLILCRWKSAQFLQVKNQLCKRGHSRLVLFSSTWKPFQTLFEGFVYNLLNLSPRPDSKLHYICRHFFFGQISRNPFFELYTIYRNQNHHWIKTTKLVVRTSEHDQVREIQASFFISWQ